MILAEIKQHALICVIQFLLSLRYLLLQGKKNNTFLYFSISLINKVVIKDMYPHLFYIVTILPTLNIPGIQEILISARVKINYLLLLYAVLLLITMVFKIKSTLKYYFRVTDKKVIKFMLLPINLPQNSVRFNLF